jgi:hypothetical protein
MKRPYIAGPMSGIPFFNFPLFDAVANQLKRWGMEPINPADLDRSVGFDPWIYTDGSIADMDPGFLREAMKRDVEAIVNEADSMVMLQGWENSTGARAEYALARWKHIPVYEMTGERKLKLIEPKTRNLTA